MPKNPNILPLSDLKKYVSRAVLRVPSNHPKTGELDTNEILATLRPSWSKVGRYLPALPGGKIEVSDFEDLIGEKLEDLDPHLILTIDQLLMAGLAAAERELYEELGLILTSGLLSFADLNTNKSGWTTVSYVAELPEKPTLLVKPDSAGTVWMDEERIKNGSPKMLPGNLGTARRSLKVLDSQIE